MAKFRLFFGQRAPAGGGTTISCTPGTATASGNAAALDIAIDASVGTATAAGLAAKLDVAVDANVGTATASGTTASLDVAVNATVGTATANGIAAAIDTGGSTTIDCAVGTATANGAQAAIDEQIACSLGTATASGMVASISVAPAGVGSPNGYSGGAYSARRKRLPGWLPVQLDDEERDRPAAEPVPIPVAIIARAVGKEAPKTPEPVEDQPPRLMVVPTPPPMSVAAVDDAILPEVNAAAEAEQEDEFVMVLVQFLLAA